MTAWPRSAKILVRDVFDNKHMDSRDALEIL